MRSIAQGPPPPAKATSTTGLPYEQPSQASYGNHDIRCFNCNEVGHIATFCPHPDRRGRAKTVPTNVLTVGKHCMMVLPNLPMWLRGIATSPHQDPIKAHVSAHLQNKELEEEAIRVRVVRRCSQNWKAQ